MTLSDLSNTVSDIFSGTEVDASFLDKFFSGIATLVSGRVFCGGVDGILFSILFYIQGVGAVAIPTPFIFCNELPSPAAPKLDL